MRIMDYEFVEHRLKRDGPHGAGPVNSRQRAEPSPKCYVSDDWWDCHGQTRSAVEGSSSGYS